MVRPPLAYVLLGAPDAVSRVRARLAQAGVQPSETTDDRGVLHILAGDAGELPPGPTGRWVLVPPHPPGPAEWRVLESGRVLDVVAADAPPPELAARLERAAHRGLGTVAETWREDVEHLLSLIRDLATSADLPALQQRIVDKLALAIGVERCSLVLLDDDAGEHARVVAASDHDGISPIIIALDRYPEIREALRTRVPVVVNDVARDPLVDPVRERLRAAGVGAVAVFPLAVDGRLFGALVLRTSRSFERPEAFALASTAAIATAIALRHGRLVGEARDAAAREQARYEGFIANLSDGVAVLDESGRVTLLNASGAAILGWSGGYRDRAFTDLARPEEPLASQILFREIERGGRVVSADLVVRLRDGRRSVLAVSAGQLHLAGRRQAILSFRDVTEQRSVQEDLRRTRDFLGRLIDASTDAILSSDMRGRILVFNRAAETLFGYTSEEARTQAHVAELYPRGGAREVMRMLREAPNGQISNTRTYARQRSGDLVPVELSAAIVRVGEEGVATVGLVRDLRERVGVEAELARMRARLIEAEKQSAITALAGATAHELNQPLTVVLGWVELLRRRVKDEAAQAPLLAISAEAERMAGIVRRIAKLTRVDTVAYPGDRRIADLESSSRAPEPTEDP